MFEYGQEAFIFFVCPLIALVFDNFLSTKIIFCILFLACLGLIPLFTDYTYTVNWLGRVFGVIAISCVFALMFDDHAPQEGKKRVAVIISGALFLILGFMALVDQGFGGSRTVEKKWQTGAYRVEYVLSQGFAGGPGHWYVLNKVAVMSVFIKNLETADKDTVDLCRVVFPKSNMVLDECRGEIRALATNKADSTKIPVQ